MNGEVSTMIEIVACTVSLSRKRGIIDINIGINDAATVIYPRANVLRNTGFKTAAGCTAVTRRQLTEERG